MRALLVKSSQEAATELIAKLLVVWARNIPVTKKRAAKIVSRRENMPKPPLSHNYFVPLGAADSIRESHYQLDVIKSASHSGRVPALGRLVRKAQRRHAVTRQAVNRPGRRSDRLVCIETNTVPAVGRHRRQNVGSARGAGGQISVLY